MGRFILKYEDKDCGYSVESCTNRVTTVQFETVTWTEALVQFAQFLRGCGFSNKNFEEEEENEENE